MIESQKNLSIALIRPLLDSAGANLFESEFLQQNSPRALKCLKDPNARIPLSEADQLISTISQQQNQQDICIKGPYLAGTHSGCQIQNLFLCSNSLREALYYIEKYAVLLSDNLEINITRTKSDSIKIKLPVEEQAMLSHNRHRNELFISTLVNWMQQLCGLELELEAIHLPFPQPSYADAYHKYWKTQIHYNSEECFIQFHSSWLDKGVHNTNPHILNLIKKEVEDFYKKLTRSGSLADRIRVALAQDKLSYGANQQEVASHFHISARTLNRHLQKEETSLKQIITLCRIEKSKILLTEGSDTIEQIALNLGLSGRRTLDRIFIKATDESPAQYRSRNLKPAALIKAAG